MSDVSEFNSRPKLSPKDFVLHLGAMVALYISSGALLTVLWNHIDALFKDSLEYWQDPYGSGMRFAISILIIAFPLYLTLTRIVNVDMRRNPEKRTLPFRKWLLYLTLLAAGAGMAVDGVSLVYTFLEGEITTRFVLKILSTFVVFAAIFAYYLYDLRGIWGMRERMSKLVGAGISVVVVAILTASFVAVGSPLTQRLVRFDMQKISDLQIIQSQVVSYWQQTETLPKSLDDIAGFSAPTDSQHETSYEYERVSAFTFKLCATFNLPSEEKPVIEKTTWYGIPGVVNSEVWTHGAHYQCFERTIDPDQINTFEKNIPIMVR